MTALHGRRDELELVRTVLAGGRHVVITGEAGIGKSQLWREALAHQRARRVVRTVATATLQAIPFGAFAAFVPRRATTQTDDPLAQLVAALDWFRQESAADHPILAVDDAHLLDEQSAAVVGLIAEQSLATVLLTVRSGTDPHDAIRGLGVGDLADIIALRPLDVDAAAALVEELVGEPVERRTHQRLHDATGGNPLHLRELVLGGLDHGAFADVGGVAAWRGELLAGPSLAAVIAARLAALDPLVRECAEVVAVAGPLPVALLEAICLPLTVAAALRSGVVRTRLDPGRAVIEPGHPLYTPALLEHVDATRTRAILEELIEVAETRGLKDRADEARLASWLMALADRSHPGVLLAAARRAFDGSDVRLAQRLAQAAVDAGAGDEAALLAHRINTVLGDTADAAPQVQPDADEAAVVQVAMTEAERFLFGFGSAADALDGLDRGIAALAPGRARDELIGVALGVRLNAGNKSAEVIAAADDLLAGDPHPAAVIRAALAGGPALAVAGRTAEAVALLERGVAAIPRAEGSRFIADQVQATLAQALVHDGRLDDAEHLVVTGREEAAASGDASSRAGWAIVAGQIDLWRGRPRSATRRFGEALAIMGPIDLIGYRTRCQADLAFALAWSGDPGPGEEPCVPEHGSHGAFFAPLILLSLAERQAALGSLAAAERLARLASERADVMEQPAVATMALHVAVRVKPAKGAASQLRSLRRRTGGGLAAMCLDAAEAVVSDDPHALETMAGRWDAFGSPALAVEYFARSAVAYEHGGYRPAARRCRTAALDRLGQVEAQPPLGRIPSAAQPLTLREREVASLAAGGLTNAEIAARLGLSVRTVHTHLQVVYQKVGVNRREALPGLLG